MFEFNHGGKHGTMSYLWILLTLLALALVGCGGGGQGADDPGDAASSRVPVVVARLYLGGDVAGATLRLEDLSGRVFATGLTNRNGMVYFENVVAPPDFRAVATLPGFSRDFRAEMRAFDQTHRQVRVDPLTELASRYLESNPGISLSEAERRVKQAVQVPDSISVSIGLDEPNPVFSDLALFRAAGQNGGWAAYSAVIVNGGSRPYRLSRDQLDRPITGLEDGLLAVAEASRVRMQKRLGIPDATPQRLVLSLPHEITLLSGPTSLGGQFLLGIGTGLATDLIETGANAVIGWAANQMGLNYGMSGQLDEIESQLNDLTNLVIGLVSTINDDSLENDIQNANDLLATMQTANTAMLTNLKSADVTNQPFSPPPSFSTLVADINAVNYPAVLAQVHNALLGPTQIIKKGQGIVLNQFYGIDGPNGCQNFPWRANQLLDQILPLYQNFAGQQTQALNLYAEQAHNYLLYPNPVLGVAALEPNFQRAAANLKAQRQQLPFYMSGYGTLVDYENGVMWWDNMYEKCSWDAALAAANTFAVQVVLADGSVQIYTGWRLPTYGEFVSLQNRGKYCPAYDPSVPVNSHDSYPDTGQATAGLPALGFQNVADALKNSLNDNGKNGDMWMSYYEFYDDTFTLYNFWEFRLNHAKTIDNTSYEATTKDQNVYLLCRGFGPDTLVTVIASGKDHHPDPGTFGQSFTAADCAQYGVPTNITVSTTPAPASISYPDAVDNTKTDTFNIPSGSLQAVAAVTYTINTGGSFKMGYGHTGSYSNSAHSYNGTVSTAERGTGHSNMVRELVNWTSSDNSALRMLNLPYVSGIAIPLKTSPANISASLLGAGGVSINGSVQVTPKAVSPHTLTSISITPRNQIYGVVPAQPAKGSFPYYCTGFYADGSMETLALNVTWTVPVNAALAQIVANAGGVSLSMNQPGQVTPVPYNVTVTASYQGKADNTTIQIVPPVAP